MAGRVGAIRRGWAALVLLVLLVSIPTGSRAGQISTLDVEGNQSMAAETVLARTALKVGGAFDGAIGDKAIQDLFATGLFADVRIGEERGRVTVRVRENPIIARIAFEGNVAVEAAKLEAVVRLKARDRHTPAKAHTETLRVREYYRSLGRMTTTVEAKTKPARDGQVDLTFAIREGEVTKVESIAFVGNRAFSAGQLRDVISTSESGWFDILKTAAFYDAERLKHDQELLRRYYRKNGFPDASVVDMRAEKNEGGTAYRVVFVIEEGRRFAMRAGRIDTAIAKVEVAELEPVRQVAEGGTYNEDAIDKSVERMSLALSEQGHVFARVRAVPQRDAASGTITVGFRIEQGPQAYAERIEIAGNSKTKDYVIRRELRLGEGDPVNALLLERARKRVEALGFFKKVSIRHTRGSGPDTYVVTVEVVEDDSRNIGFGVGYSTSEGVVGDLNLGEKNLLGTGQKLTLKLAGSLTRFQAEVGFTEPRFLGSSVAAGFDLFYKNIDYSQYASYKAQTIGAKLRASYPIDDAWTAGVNYTIAHNTLYDVGANASPAIKQAIAGYPSASSSSYLTSSAGYSLAYDGRDDKRRPTQGVTFTLAQDMAGLGGDVRYIRNVGEVKGYYPVTDGVVGVARATGGQITGWGGQDVRLLDLFYKGNDLVRGFAPAGIGPRDALSTNGDALGGRSYFSTSAELLFQIPGVPQEMGLRGAVFADAGALWNTNRTAAANAGTVGNSLTVRSSVGVGLGWESPIGTLRVDYAIPTAKQPFDKTQPLSFGLSPF